MRKLLFCFLLLYSFAFSAQAQKSPCTTNPVYRQFDFWIGDWDVYGLNGKKAGESKIELVLDSCIVMENYTTANGKYSGKSFNTFNSLTNQWQQTWVDNAGGTLEYLEGKFENNRMTLLTKPFTFSKDTIAIRKLSFYNLSADKLRQHFEITKDNGVTWKTEYDLEYRRRRS